MNMALAWILCGGAAAAMQIRRARYCFDHPPAAVTGSRARWYGHLALLVMAGPLAVFALIVEKVRR